MSKKAYIALADLIRKERHLFSFDLVEKLATMCEAQNPRFNRDRWMEYINKPREESDEPLPDKP